MSDDTRDDDLWDAAQRKLQAGETLTKQEANAYFAAGLFNPTNQVYFRAGLIACREYMARFVEAQSPEIAASIRANWWPKLGPDFGPPRRMNWNELVASGDALPVQMREDISPTLEALPIALQFLQTPEPVNHPGVLASDADQPFFAAKDIALATMTPEQEAAAQQGWCMKCAQPSLSEKHREGGMCWLQCSRCTTVYALGVAVAPDQTLMVSKTD